MQWNHLPQKMSPSSFVRKRWRYAWFLPGALACCLSAFSQDRLASENVRSEGSQTIGAVPPEVRSRLNLSPFYKKYTAVNGLPILSSENVSDEGILEAARIVSEMLRERRDIQDALVKNRVRVAIMSPMELTTNIPEHSDMRPKEYWDRRARGMGATPARPATSCGEENLLNLPGDHYPRENILIHEFAHTMHIMGLRSIDSTFESRLGRAYQNALARGLWANTFAATSPAEYWAETTQSYFDANDSNNPAHNDISTRDKLSRYDPEIFSLLEEVFRHSTWRYERYEVRQRKSSINFAK